MLRKLLPPILSILFCCLFQQPSVAQEDSLSRLSKKFDHYWDQHYPENIFVHTSQTFFLTGETIWFNAFLVDGFFHRPSNLSKVVYVEVIDKDNISVLKTKVSAHNGNGNGNLFIPSTLPSGKYVLTAYTRWMRNFRSASYFHQSITILNPFVPLDPKPKSEMPPYDIQFFPEGGNLIAGLPNTVGFRAVGKDGKGITFKGAILNDRNDTIVGISPKKFGLGRFVLTPESGQHYTMVFSDSTRQKIVTPIPSPSSNGYVLHINESENYIEVEVQSKISNILANQQVYLFVQSHQLKISALTHPLHNGRATFTLDKNKFKEGVNHLTLFDDNLHAVCERLYFKKPQHPLQMELRSDSENYQRRAKIELELTIHASNGNPCKAFSSVSVYRIDSLEQDESTDISTYFWLSSELKGTIESPKYYLSGNSDKEVVDNLMLTHGWSQFKWEDILVSQNFSPHFIPEYGGHLVTGRVFKRNGNLAPAVNTYFSVVGKDAQLYVSRSNPEGKVVYETSQLIGKRNVVVQANSEVDSTLSIVLDAAFSDAHEKTDLADFSISEKSSNRLTQRNLAMQVQYSFNKKNRHETIAKDSLPFYGLPSESYRLDDYTRFATMEEVLREYVSGIEVRKSKENFHFRTFDRTNNTLFKDNPLVMLDGVPVFNLNKIMAYDPLKIQKIDVITKQYHLGYLTFDGLMNCTTYKGNLTDFTPGTTSIALEGVQPKKEFFSPRYEIKSQKGSRLPDKRYLLFWSPDARVDNVGKSHLTFYSSDVSGGYQVIVQALSESGEFGSTTATFQIKK